MQKKLIDLKDFIPRTIICNEGHGQEVPLHFNYDDDFIYLSYTVNQFNGSWKEHSLTLPRFISKSKETFEVLGLLQAECSKTQRGCFTFCNHEFSLINKVITWFEKELKFDRTKWRWYIKVNINEPEDLTYKQQIEKKLIGYWCEKTNILTSKAYPKIVTYITNTSNKKLKFYDKGTLIIEYKNNLFNNFITNLLKIITFDVEQQEQELILSFMKGIIAGESCVEIDKKFKKYRVHISANNENEKEVYNKYLSLLGIKGKNYRGDKLVISERGNLVKLLKLRLMTLSKEKYSKFLYMMQHYPGISQETGYFAGEKKVWNKIPQEKIDEILELYRAGITRTKEIAEKIGVSHIKVCRVLKENNLGKRRRTILEEKRKEIANFAQENKNLTQSQIADCFQVSQMAVCRVCAKYSIKIVNK